MPKDRELLHPEQELLLPVNNVASINNTDVDDDAGAGADGGGGLTTLGIDRNFANVLTMALGYVLVFTAFQTTQSLAASLLGDLGNFSIAIIYVVFTVAGFIAPVIVRSISPRIGMFAGSLTYALFVGSLIYMIAPLVLAASTLIGFGAAVLWCSQGVMMTQCTNDSNKTKYYSTFWGIFGLCMLPGNLASHFLLLKSENDPSSSDSSASNPFKPLVKGWSTQNSPLFIVLTICAAIGSCAFLLLRKPDPISGSVAVRETRSIFTQIRATFALLAVPRMICLLPLFTFTGLAMTMWASWFTRQMYKVEIGLVMCSFGAAEFVGGFTIGRFVESYGRSAGLILGTACMFGAYYLTYTGYDTLSDHCAELHPLNVTNGSAKPCKEFKDYTPFYAAATLYGFMDCSFQTITAAICAKSFHSTGHTADAWALFRTFQSMGSAVGFFVSPLLTIKGETYATKNQLLIEIGITAAVGVLSLYGHWLFCKYSSVGAEAKGVVSSDSYEACIARNGLICSQAVCANGIVVTSGIGGGGSTDTSTYGQATHAFDSASTVLSNAASSCRQAIRVGIQTTPVADLQVVLERYNDFFIFEGTPAPAMCISEVSRLPNGSIVQVEVTATT